MKMRKMTQAERDKLLDLRIRSKIGEHLSDEDLSFCKDMFAKYPDEYPKDAEVIELVRPLVNPFD